jgi:hypothetical protein
MPHQAPLQTAGARRGDRVAKMVVRPLGRRVGQGEWAWQDAPPLGNCATDEFDPLQRSSQFVDHPVNFFDRVIAVRADSQAAGPAARDAGGFQLLPQVARVLAG